MIFALYRDSFAEIIGYFYCFIPEIVKKTSIDKHCVFDNNDGSSFSFSKFIFLMHIRNYVFDSNALFFVKVAKPDGYEFFFTICIECFY